MSQGAEIIPIVGEPRRFHVASSKNPDHLYLVDLDELDCGWCGCPHFEYRLAASLPPIGPCKHISAVRAFVNNRRERDCH